MQLLHTRADHREIVGGAGAGHGFLPFALLRAWFVERRSTIWKRPTPERCLEAYYLQRTRFDRIAEGKLRRRQLTDDGNVEITGRDLREGAAGRLERLGGHPRGCDALG
jgi:hypothetical protein